MQTTIIVICNDWDHFLDESLTNLKLQTAKPAIIVLDDGSTPNVKTIANNHKVQSVTFSDSKNHIERMNRVMKYVKTPYYMFVGVDDLFDPRYVKEAEEVLNDTKKIDVVHCDIEKFGIEEGRWNSQGLVDGIHIGPTMFFSSITRKSLWKRLGGYDENIPYAQLEDWDFWVRAYFAGARSYHIPEMYFKYRCHPAQSHRTITAPNLGEISAYLAPKWEVIKAEYDKSKS